MNEANSKQNNVVNERLLARLDSVIQSIDSGAVQSDEFARAIKAILNVVKGIKLTLESDISLLKTGHEDKILEINADISQLEDFMREVESTSTEYTKEQVLKLEDRIKSSIKDIRDSIPNMPDLSDINSRIENAYKKFEEIENKKPEEIKATFIRDRLESLQDEDRLDASAIKNLKKYIDIELSKIKTSGKTVYVGGGSSGGGRIVKSYDLFSQLNGVLKTFSLPAFHRVISVHSASFPFSFRENVDYTTDASAMTITFTSEIIPQETLATGQTVTVVYSEA